MKPVSTTASLSDVSSTLLITLYARAAETQSKNPILNDHKAVEVANALDAELAASALASHLRLAKRRLPRKLAVTMALRARYFDRVAARWLVEHPGGVVVNLGCGLDSRSERIDDGEAVWLELDLPAVIDLRRRFFSEGPRRRFIASSVTDLGWTSHLAAFQGRPVLFLAEGLFMYLQEEPLRSLVARLRVEFPGSTLVCDLSNRWLVDRMDRWWMRRKLGSLGIGRNAAFSFGVRDAHELESWADGVTLVDEWSYFDDRDSKLGWLRWLGRFSRYRKMQWSAVYLLGG